MENPSQPKTGGWARRFFTIWTGQALSLFGSALVQFALIWWLTQESGSATVLAIATLVGMLPQIVIGPFAGALVDRWNRRIIMIAADAMIAIFTLLLAYLFATGTIQIWHVYAIMAIRSLGGAFHFPAMAASTPLMVPDEQLTRINGLNQALQGVNSLVAPPAGALLISILPTQGILMIDVGTAMLAILPLLF
jgi:DHA3 family macrolide efflux protein-like MFS transporter